MRIVFVLLVLANAALFIYTWLDRFGTGEGVRLAQQVQPEKITLLTPQQVAALGPAKASALADVCVEWGPLSEGEKTRALAVLEPLDLARLISQKKVEVIANYWVFIAPAANKPAADRRLEELKALGIRDVALIDSGPQRFAISLGVFRTEEAAQARLSALQAQGVKAAKVGGRAQSIQQTLLVVRDPPAPAVARMKELQGSFPGSEIRIGTCDKTT
ncbi:MAG: SPOR domain-containing protein [Betaproteobacteria bacterium]|nr:MAG: SPOR domain-containing protein [Betaproteobacteria bacterium]